MRHISISLFLLLLCACTQDSPPTAIGISSVDWPNYANDPGSSKYADLEQINRDTVAQLEIAWVWESVDNVAVAQRPQLCSLRFQSHANQDRGYALCQYATGSRGGSGCCQWQAEVGVQYLYLGTRPAGKQRI